MTFNEKYIEKRNVMDGCNRIVNNNEYNYIKLNYYIQIWEIEKHFIVTVSDGWRMEDI